MATIVFYFPWTADTVSEDQLPSQAWEITGVALKGHTFRREYWTGAINTALADLTDQTIYLRGHGDRDSDSITPRNDSNDNALKPVHVVDRLIKSGLKKEYTGKFKLYNCFSAISFGPKFVLLMKHVGYTNCEYYAYKEAVNQVYMTHKGQRHKYITKTLEYKDYTMGSPDYGRYPVAAYRASDVRLKL
jgi:hypothetical protein